MDKLIELVTSGEKTQMCSAAAQGASEIYLFALITSTLLILVVGIYVWQKMNRANRAQTGESEREKGVEDGSVKGLTI